MRVWKLKCFQTNIVSKTKLLTRRKVGFLFPLIVPIIKVYNFTINKERNKLKVVETVVDIVMETTIFHCKKLK